MQSRRVSGMLILYFNRVSSRWFKNEFRIWKQLFGPVHLFSGENANNELSDEFVAGMSVGLDVKKQ